MKSGHSGANRQPATDNRQPASGSGPASVARPATSNDQPLWRWGWLAAGLLAVAAYWASFGNGFVWDDPLVLRQLRAIQGVGDLVVLPPEIPKVYYRPLVFASFLLDRALGGEQPFWFHFSVVLWHVAATLLVFALTRRLCATDARLDDSSRSIAATAAAVLFAVHPVHVESVAWMAGRSDVIAGVLLLGGLILHARGAAARWLGVGCFLLALLAKESVALAVALPPLLDWTLRRRVQKSAAAAWLAALAVYALLRQIGISMLGEPLPAGWASPLRLFYALGFYVEKAILPLSQSVYPDAVPEDPLHALLGAAALLASFAGGWIAWRRDRRVVVFALAFSWLTLAPALLLILRRIATTPLAERYLYVPSMGLAILAGCALASVVGRAAARRAALAGLAIAALVGVVVCVQRNAVWANEMAFWGAAAAVSADILPQREYADAILRRGDLDAAQAAYEAALQRQGSAPERAMTLANLGNLYRRRDRVDAAVASFEEAVLLAPHPAMYHGLGLVRMRQAELAQRAKDQQAVVAAVVAAREALERSLAMGSAAPPGTYRDWSAPKTHVMLAQVLHSLHQTDLARQHYEAALQIEPYGSVADAARQGLQRLGP